MRLFSPALLVVALACGHPALAAEPAPAPGWPPSEAARDRIVELRAVMSSREATPGEREAARRELAAMLRSPAAPAEPVKAVARAPRAAIAPFPALVSPVAPLPQAPAAVMVPAPRTMPAWPDAESERAASRFKVDPATGGVMVRTPQGYVDPNTGHRLPKR